MNTLKNNVRFSICILLLYLPNIVVSQSLSTEITVSKTITKDSFVRHTVGTSNNTLNSGKNQYLLVYKNAPGGNSQYIRTYIQADIDDIPQGVIIKNATLYLYGTGSHAGLNPSKVHQVDTAWVDTTITWNNMPSYTQSGSDPTLSQSTSAAQDYKVNVTTLVQTELASGLFNIVIKKISETDNGGFYFYSANSSNSEKHPKLVITYSIEEPFVLAKALPSGQLTWIDDMLGIAYPSTEEAPVAVEIYKNNDELVYSEVVDALIGTNYHILNLSNTSLFTRNEYYTVKVITHRGEHLFLYIYLTT